MAEAKTENKFEKEFVIPLRSKYKHAARYKKTPKAIKSVKEYIVRHMRIYDKDLNKVKLDKAVNEFLWARGIKNPPFSVKVKANKNSEDGTVKVELVSLPDKLKFKKLREEKVSKEAKEAIESKKGFKERMQDQVKGTFQGGDKAEEAQGQEEKSGELKAENKTEKVDKDKNQDGVDDKVEEKEAKESSKEATQKMEKDMAKKEKHTTKSKTPKQEKNDKKEYNKSSRGK